MHVLFTKWLPDMIRKDGHTIKNVSENLLKARQCTYKGNFKVRSCNHFWRGKGISITYFECL